jgi:uncharacterized membrane protein
MRSINIITVIFLFILCLETATAATLHGKVYDLDLNELSNVILEVNTTPHQRFVSRDGNYTFSLNPGKYSIVASYSPDGQNLYNDTEEVSISDEGDYVFDIFIIPPIDENFEYDSVPISEPEVVAAAKNNSSQSVLFIVLIAAVIACATIIAIYKTRNKHKPVTPEPVHKVEPKAVPVEPVSDDDMALIKRILTEEGGRMSQKDIRKKIPLSEAKVSLMISELEHKGVIEKIKKGRTNIVILKR